MKELGYGRLSESFARFDNQNAVVVPYPLKEIGVELSGFAEVPKREMQVVQVTSTADATIQNTQVRKFFGVGSEFLA